jgi:hypothetical protein
MAKGNPAFPVSPLDAQPDAFSMPLCRTPSNHGRLKSLNLVFVESPGLIERAFQRLADRRLISLNLERCLRYCVGTTAQNVIMMLRSHIWQRSKTSFVRGARWRGS